MEEIIFHHWLSQHPNIGFFVMVFTIIGILGSIFSKNFRTFMMVQWFTFAVESAKAAVQGIVKLLVWLAKVLGKGFKIMMVFLFTSFGRIASDHRQIQKVKRNKRISDHDDPLA